MRKDGSIGSLFINRRQRLPIGVWIDAEEHPTPRYAYRPGWHCTTAPYAPHLGEKDRQWYVVDTEGETLYNRPESQGGVWVLAQRIKILYPVIKEEQEE